MIVSCFSFIERIATRAEVDLLYDACAFLRQQALATGMQQTLSFDLNHHAYHYSSHEHQLSSFVTFGTKQGAKGPPSTPTHLIQSPISFKNQRIDFSPTGIISAGTAYIIDRKNRYSYAVSSAVAPFSKIRTYLYRDSSWIALSSL